MKKMTLLAVALVLGWLGVAQAQVWLDPYTRGDGTYVGEDYRSNWNGNPNNNWSQPGKVNPYTGKQATGDPNRYSEQYQNRNNGQNQYQFNPYQFRW
jgi:opacity protein-like surface antigen